MLRTPIAAALIISVSSLAGTACGEDADSSDRQEIATGSDPSRAEIHGKVVDEKGLPVAAAAVSILAVRDPDKQDSIATAADGTFRLVLDSPSPRFASLIVRSADWAYQSLVTLDEPNTLARVTEIEVTLRPARRLAVEVLDETGRPVAGAKVAVIVSYQPVADVMTGRTGIASMLIPPDAEVDWIIAFKPGIGFDYFENYHAFPTSGRPIPPEAVRLRLRGSRHVEVKVVDSADRPVQGVRLRPWMIQTPGRISYVNLSGIRLTDATTDGSGIARFDWIPARLERGLGFLVIHEAYHCPERPHLLGDDSAGDLLTAEVSRKASIAGSVVNQDGTPAAGILIEVEGRGETSEYFRGFARTDQDGRYDVAVAPNQSYIAAVMSEEWAAPAHVGLLLGEGDRRAGVDFKLSRGTAIRGVITVGAEFAPAPGETVTLIQQDKLVRWALTDKSGCYQLRVGPGVYELRLPHSTEHERLTIAGLTEPDVIRDYHVPRRSRGPLIGQILRDDGRPEINALLVGASIAEPRHGSFDAVCGANGRFQVERWRDDMLVYARSRDGMRAGFAHVSAESDELEIRMHPAGAAFGIVLGSDGTPVEGARLSCRIDIPGIDLAHPIVFRTRTNAQGRFEFGGLIVGARCSTSTYYGPEDTRTSGPEQHISAPVRYDLGAITIVTSDQN